MNVKVITVDGDTYAWKHADVTYDTTILQATADGDTTTFPLVNVVSFTTSESETT